jgi:ankyrin repeat protein
LVLIVLVLTVGIRLFSPITLVFVFCCAALLIIVLTFFDLRSTGLSSTRKALAAALALIACAIPGLAIRNLWRNPDWLMRASIQGGYDRMLRWSIVRGAHPNSNLYGETPLILAVRRRNVRAISLLVTAGANPNQPDKNGLLPTVEAAGLNYADVLEQLWKGGANLSGRSAIDQMSAIDRAAEWGQTDAVRFLLYHGVLPDEVSFAGRTPLIEGAAYPQVVATLLAAHAHVDLQASDGTTALMAAAVSNAPGSVEMLLKAGANPSLKDHEGRSALDLANQYGATKVIPLLTH